MKKVLDAHGPAETTPIADFKKWYVPLLSSIRAHLTADFRHCLHYHTLRHAAICALNLGFNPKAVNDGIVLIEVDLKPNHETLPTMRRYMPISGCVGTYEESRIFFSGFISILNRNGGSLFKFHCQLGRREMKSLRVSGSATVTCSKGEAPVLLQLCCTIHTRL